MKNPNLRLFLTPAYYSAIGQAITMWATLEIEIDRTLARMLKLKKARQLRRNILSMRKRLLPTDFKSRLKLLHRLARIFYDAETYRELTRITNGLLNLYEERNRLVHGDWVWVNKSD